MTTNIIIIVNIIIGDHLSPADKTFFRFVPANV